MHTASNYDSPIPSLTETLPSELILEILQWLPRSDFLSVRRTSKTIMQFIEPTFIRHFVRHLVLECTTPELERLHKIASSRFAPHVCSLVLWSIRPPVVEEVQLRSTMLQKAVLGLPESVAVRIWHREWMPWTHLDEDEEKVATATFAQCVERVLRNGGSSAFVDDGCREFIAGLCRRYEELMATMKAIAATAGNSDLDGSLSVFQEIEVQFRRAASIAAAPPPSLAPAAVETAVDMVVEAAQEFDNESSFFAFADGLAADTYNTAMFELERFSRDTSYDWATSSVMGWLTNGLHESKGDAGSDV